MQRALMWLNLYGREAVWHKGKNSLKTPNMHFLPVFELMSDSFTTIQVKPHQCPSHQSILLIQGPISEILRIGDFKKQIIFKWAILDLFSKKCCFISMKIRQRFLDIIGGTKF